MLAIKSCIVVVIYMAQCNFAETCSIDISGTELIIKDMIETQGNFCSIPVQILNDANMTNDCDSWALIYEVERLLEKLKFLPDSNIHRNKIHLRNTFQDCANELDLDTEYEKTLNTYLQTENLSPFNILKRVNESLHKLHGFQGDSFSFSQCESYYKKRRKDPTTGPPCTCPFPTTPISSSETSKTSVNNLSEHASSTFTTSYSYHTNPLTENVSTDYSKKLEKPQGLDSSPSTTTNMPSELKPLTTIMDHSYTATTMKPETYTDSPLTNPNSPRHSTEFTPGIYKSSDTRTVSEQDKNNSSDPGTEGMYESVVSSTVETTSSLRNGEVSTAMEPDEIQETTMSEFNSQSSKRSLFQNSLSVPSKESGIETSSIPVTKKLRSPVNMDAISRAVVTTQSVSSLSASASDPNLRFPNSVPKNIPSRGMSLSNSKSPEPVPQGKVIGDKNLGWASSYLPTTMMTTKTELSMSSAMPGGQRFISDVTHNPVLNVHESYNIVPQKLRDKDMDSFSGFNKENPPVSTAHTISTVILVVLALLFLCGLLYYRHQYRVLQRRLDMGYNLDLARNPGAEFPEERVPLPAVESDIV